MLLFGFVPRRESLVTTLAQSRKVVCLLICSDNASAAKKAGWVGSGVIWREGVDTLGDAAMDDATYTRAPPSRSQPYTHARVTRSKYTLTTKYTHTRAHAHTPTHATSRRKKTRAKMAARRRSSGSGIRVFAIVALLAAVHGLSEDGALLDGRLVTPLHAWSPVKGFFREGGTVMVREENRDHLGFFFGRCSFLPHPLSSSFLTAVI